MDKIIAKLRLNRSHVTSLILLLLAAFIVQAYIASWPDTMGDVEWYRNWCRTLANEGLESAYWGERLKEIKFVAAGINIDYPPIYPYILYVIGKVYKLLAPTSFEANNDLLDFFIKTPAALANIIISLLIFIELRKKTKSRTALLVASAYAFNPAILFDTNYWGQTDSINSLFVLLSIIFLSNKKPEWSWVSITFAVFMKPLAYPFAPIIVLFTLKRFGMKRTLRCALAAIITTFVIFLPFIYTNRLSDITYGLFTQLNTSPNISNYAHNIWWIIGEGVPLVRAYIKPFGLISYKAIGLALFGVFYIISLLRFSRWNNENSLYYLCASVAFGLFILSTQMYDNHFFTFFPLLSMIYFHDKRLKWIYVILTFTFLANMVLHDPFILTSLEPFSIGRVLRIPDELGGDISLVRLFMTLFNAQINILVFCYWIYYFYLSENVPLNLGLFEEGIKFDRLSLTKVAAAVVLFISLTSIPFIVKVARFENEYFFMSNLDTAEIKTLEDQYVVRSYFNINNDMRYVIFEHPPSEITYKLTLPERASLSFGIALNPDTWSADKGDGVLFELYVQDGGIPERVFSKYIDPKHNVSDRKWHDEVVDLSRYGGKEVRLSFVTTAGFNYNGDFDWAGWSNPNIVTINHELKDLLAK